MSNDEHRTDVQVMLTPAEREMLVGAWNMLGSIWSELQSINRKLDELAGRSGTLEYVKGRTTADLLQLYELMKSTEPSLTKKEFAGRLGIKVATLYTTTARTNKRTKRTN